MQMEPCLPRPEQLGLGVVGGGGSIQKMWEKTTTVWTIVFGSDFYSMDCRNISFAR